MGGSECSSNKYFLLIDGAANRQRYTYADAKREAVLWLKETPTINVIIGKEVTRVERNTELYNYIDL